MPALFAFIQQEVPFRLENIFNIPSEKITPNIVDVCVWSLYDNSDVMFDYDSMDDHLREVLKEYDIDPDDYEEEEEENLARKDSSVPIAVLSQSEIDRRMGKLKRT